MTKHVARLYAIVVGVVVFFVAWAAVAAHPWQASATAADPRLAALAARQALLQREAIHAKQIVDRRWAAYRVALKHRTAAIAQVNAAQARAQAAQTQVVSASVPAASSYTPAAAAPAVRVVTLPPLVITRTS